MILAALLLAMPAAGEATLDCESPQTQLEMNLCSARTFEKADAALNAQWTATLAEMRRLDSLTRTGFPPPTYEEALRDAQLAWLAYRDAQCGLLGMENRGGSAQPMAHSDCLAELTKARTEDLREIVEIMR